MAFRERFCVVLATFLSKGHLTNRRNPAPFVIRCFPMTKIQDESNGVSNIPPTLVRG